MITFTSKNNEMIVKFEDDINFETVRTLELKIKEQSFPSTLKTLTVDLQNVKFVDSSGVGFLISWLHPYISIMKTEIINTSAPVRNILHICKLDNYVTIV